MGTVKTARDHGRELSILSVNEVTQTERLPNDASDVLEARGRLLLTGFYWFFWIFDFLFLSSAYYFYESDGVFEFIFHNALFMFGYGLIIFLFISFGAVLFFARPVISIERDRIVFPLIRFSISRDEVQSATPQSGGISEHWRVKIKLKHNKPGSFRTWLLLPTAAAYNGHIYVLPMMLAPNQGLIKERIVEALSLGQESSDQGAPTHVGEAS